MCSVVLRGTHYGVHKICCCWHCPLALLQLLVCWQSAPVISGGVFTKPQVQIHQCQVPEPPELHSGIYHVRYGGSLDPGPAQPAWAYAHKARFIPAVGASNVHVVVLQVLSLQSWLQWCKSMDFTAMGLRADFNPTYV